jgi:hypothetical protein
MGPEAEFGDAGMGENPLLVFFLMGGLAWLLGWPLALFPLD